jgi:hypothetical protein
VTFLVGGEERPVGQPGQANRRAEAAGDYFRRNPVGGHAQHRAVVVVKRMLGVPRGLDVEQAAVGLHQETGGRFVEVLAVPPGVRNVLEEVDLPVIVAIDNARNLVASQHEGFTATYGDPEGLVQSRGHAGPP